MKHVGNSLCVIIGGGGHARVVIESVRASGVASLYGILDSNPSLWGKNLMGVPILGGDNLLRQLTYKGVTRFVIGVGGVGDNRIRRHLFKLALEYGLQPLTVCHPTALCSPSAQIGKGSVVYPMAVVNAGVQLGVNVIVNTGAIIEHDCIVGDHVHVATGARLGSTVHVDDGAHVGIGASVRQCIHIGQGAVVGAGAAVVKNVEAQTVVAGVPAFVIKYLGAESGREPDS